ncbi:DUF6542 domain-containing protein [Nakamurella leprariae]|uniref:DUF6542 domain-containing protein n=1 Tax=Nakamurella leprariae TaxID=2803911 RepID=A0A939C2I8_9ACTN|nr:DUF6542 domain-containing protein [Nakamurella leprariae]MBM9468309.1 hypothetical protein [Nakamurella leprariae]
MSVHPPTARPVAAAASAVTTRPGIHWWVAVLVALVASLLGAAVDGMASGALGWGLQIGFVAGVVVAALLIRRDSLFTAMVQPPLVLVVAILVGSTVFAETGLYATALRVVAGFPTMLVGTAAAVVIGVIRIVAQPNRSSSRRLAPRDPA